MTLESQMIILFGATGDLARRKLIPALYHLHRRHRLSDCTPVVCVGRRSMTRDMFLAHLEAEKFIGDKNDAALTDLLRKIEYLQYDQRSDTVADFADAVSALRSRYGCASNLLIYLALPTSAFLTTAELIAGLDPDSGWRRVVFEKPFGEDLPSAVQLNEYIRKVLTEDEIYRVDHYLGKELVQNILTLRFANEVFAGSWRNTAIDHVQITVAETLGVEKRAGYYDRSGAVRDMVQNHLLQLLSFVAMEPPQEGEQDGLRNSAVAVLEHLRPPESADVVLGQYGPGTIDSSEVPAYTQEEGIADDSRTETFCALRAHVDTPRWQGVPFYLRTGKRLSSRYADIRIVFRQKRRHIVGADGIANMIIIRIQPDEGIALAFNVQKPGDEDHTTPVMMDFCHHCHFGPNTPEAYESILRNVMGGDHSIFPRHDWIEASWKYVDRLLAVASPPSLYPAGSMGPDLSEKLLASDGRSWSTEEPAPRISTFPVAK